MAEFNPPTGYSFDPGGFDKNSGKGDKKKSVPSFRPSFGESKPAPSFMEVGNTPFNGFGGKELGGEAVKSALFERDKTEAPKPEAELREPAVRQSEPAAERSSIESQTHEAAERDAAEAERLKPREHSELQAISPEQLASLAAAEAQAQLHAHELAREAVEESDDDKSKKAKTKDKLGQPTQPDAEPETQASEPETPRAETLEEMLAREMPTEFAEATSDKHLTNEATPDLPPAATTAAEMPPAEQVEARQDNETPRLPQTDESHSFEAFVQQHEELEDFARPLSDEALAAAAEPSAAGEHASDDDVFREMARNETGEDPGRATLHDVEPGEPPVDTSGGENQPPNQPPTARGGGRGGNWANPNGAPTPFGSNLDPLTMAGMAALGARERFHHWEHRMAEVTLLGGELLLAAGLVGEHLWNGHKRRQMKRDYNRKFKQQSKALKETNQQLEQEHLRHQQTRRQLENVSARQTATNEELRRASEHKVPLAEAAAGVGLISAAAASELAARAERTGAAPAPAKTNEKINERELAQRLRNSRELGRAIERNPELRDSFSAAEVAGTAATIAAAEKAGVQPQQLRELVGSSTYADTLRRERNYEYLQTEPTDDAGQVRQAGGADAPHNMPSASSPQQQPTMPLATQSDAQLTAPTDERSAHRSMVKPVAAATVLFILGIILIAIFMR